MGDSIIHWAQLDGQTAGAPWCRSDPSVATTDKQNTIITRNEKAVTCPECWEHLHVAPQQLKQEIRQQARREVRPQIDWFGEGDD